MMTCADCLNLIATADVRDVALHEEILRHASECQHCSAALTRVVTAEQELAVRVGAVQSPLQPQRTAEMVLARLRRRTITRFSAALFTVILAVAVWAIWLRVIVPGYRETQAIVKGDARTETIPLTCLSSEQAGQLLSPYLRSSGSIYYLAKPPLKIITVRATPAELQTVHELLARFDGAGRPGCAAP